MMTDNKPIWADVKPWHPLTEIPERKKPAPTGAPDNLRQTSKTPTDIRPPPPSINPALMRLLFDIVTYPYSDISARIKRLGLSARVFETAKREGLERGFIVESSAGQTLYLIPTKKTFSVLGMEDPYERAVSVEHAFYVNGLSWLLKQDPRYRAVVPEAKIGSTSATSDVITIAQNGMRSAWELTLSTSNLLSQAGKYVATDMVRITFVCRDCKLRDAVKACCREGGLDPDLLAKLDYTHWSALLRQQRSMHRY
jgi:hypothetical protein